MSPWFERRKATPPVAGAAAHYVSASTAINASQRQVWDFIKPPENSVLLSPDVVRGFRAPGVEGVGEIQVFISVRDGVEHVSALEVVEEIPQELAITRTIGAEDPAARGRTFLRPGDGGATVLQVGQYFSLPAGSEGYFFQHEQHYKLYFRQYVERVKALLEQPFMAASDSPRDAGEPTPGS